MLNFAPQRDQSCDYRWTSKDAWHLFLCSGCRKDPIKVEVQPLHLACKQPTSELGISEVLQNVGIALQCVQQRRTPVLWW